MFIFRAALSLQYNLELLQGRADEDIKNRDRIVNTYVLVHRILKVSYSWVHKPRRYRVLWWNQMYGDAVYKGNYR